MYSKLKYYISVIDPTLGAWWVKLAGVAVGALLSFILPIQDFLYLIIFFVSCDLFTGWRKSVWKNSVVDEKMEEYSIPAVFMKNFRSIESKGLGNTLEKLMIYFILMFVCNAFDWKYQLTGLASLSWYIGGMIITREIKSIFENSDYVLQTKFIDNLTKFINNFKKSA